MRLGRERSEAHRAGREAGGDCLDVLDLVERHRRADRLRAQEAADQAVLGVLLVDVLGEDGVVDWSVAVPGRGALEFRDRLGVPHVALAVAAPCIDAALGKDLLVRGGQERLLDVARAAQAVRLRPGAPVALLSLVGELGHADAADG